MKYAAAQSRYIFTFSFYIFQCSNDLFFGSLLRLANFLFLNFACNTHSTFVWLIALFLLSHIEIGKYTRTHIHHVYTHNSDLPYPLCNLPTAQFLRRLHFANHLHHIIYYWYGKIQHLIYFYFCAWLLRFWSWCKHSSFFEEFFLEWMHTVWLGRLLKTNLHLRCRCCLSFSNLNRWDVSRVTVLPQSHTLYLNHFTTSRRSYTDRYSFRYYSHAFVRWYSYSHCNCLLHVSNKYVSYFAPHEMFF